jgi:hypothetical protein
LQQLCGFFCQAFGPDPSSRLPLETLGWQLKERRIWMSSGGAKVGEGGEGFGSRWIKLFTLWETNITMENHHFLWVIQL